MVVGCGSLWNDKQMGEHWMLEPDATVKARYDVLFALLRSFLDNKPLPTSPPAPKTENAEKKQGEKEGRSRPPDRRCKNRGRWRREEPGERRKERGERKLERRTLRWGGSCTAIPGATVQLSPQQPAGREKTRTPKVGLRLPPSALLKKHQSGPFDVRPGRWRLW